MHKLATTLTLALLATWTGAAIAAESIDLVHVDPGAEAIRVRALLRYDGKVTAEAGDRSSEVDGSLELSYAQSQELSDRRFVRVVDREATETPLVCLATPSADGVIVTAIDGPMTRRELDSVQFAADPLDLPLLLPTVTVRDGETWRLPEPNVRQLMRLDEVSSAEVTGIVADVTDRHVRLRFSGPVKGRVEGAEVELDLRGVALYDRRDLRIRQCNLAWHERRGVGPATPAVTLRAKLNVTVDAAPSDAAPAAELIAIAEKAESEPRLKLFTADRRWALLASRDWYLVATDSTATTLRCVSEGRLIAVTTLTSGANSKVDDIDWNASVAESLGAAATEVGPATPLPGQPGVAITEVASTGTMRGAQVSWLHHRVDAMGGSLTATSSAPADVTEESQLAVRALIVSLREGSHEVAGPTLRRAY